MNIERPPNAPPSSALNDKESSELRRGYMTATARDNALLKRIAAGEADALSELYDVYSGLIFALARKILRDTQEAEGVVQQTFIAVWEKSRGYDPAKAKVSTWLVAIARNSAIDSLRKQKRSIEVPVAAETIASVPEDSLRSPLGNAIDAERRKIIQEALAQIPEEQMKVIYLSYYAGLSHRQIAQELDQPLGTVKTRVQLGMDKLRRKLGPIFNNE